MIQAQRLFNVASATILLCAASLVHAQQAEELLHLAAEAMGGIERLRALDNIVMTGFALNAYHMGGGNLSPHPNAPPKWIQDNAARRQFDLKNGRALYEARQAKTFPFARADHWDYLQEIQTGIEVLDHPLTALLAALDPATELGPVRTENNLYRIGKGG